MASNLGKREGGIIDDYQDSDLNNYVGIVAPFTEIGRPRERTGLG